MTEKWTTQIFVVFLVFARKFVFLSMCDIEWKLLVLWF